MATTAIDVPKSKGHKRRWLIALAVVLVLAAWMPLQFNADGSLEIYIQTASPGADKEANWLPAPASGPFNLVIRNFWPKEAAVDGTYKVPPTRKVQ